MPYFTSFGAAKRYFETEKRRAAQLAIARRTGIVQCYRPTPAEPYLNIGETAGRAVLYEMRRDGTLNETIPKNWIASFATGARTIFEQTGRKVIPPLDPQDIQIHDQRETFVWRIRRDLHHQLVNGDGGDGILDIASQIDVSAFTEVLDAIRNHGARERAKVMVKYLMEQTSIEQDANDPRWFLARMPSIEETLDPNDPDYADWVGLFLQLSHLEADTTAEAIIKIKAIITAFAEHYYNA